MYRSVALSLGAVLLVAGQCRGADFRGDWVFEPNSSFPELTTLRISETAGLQGSIRSRWYGELPLLHLHEDGERLVFHIDNGNPRLEQHDLTLSLQGGQVRLRGKFWYADLDLGAHRAKSGEYSSLSFTTFALPALRELPDNGLARTPPMGWNSWNQFAENIDADIVREMADALVSSGLRDAGYVYVNIDDGWQGQRAADGTLQTNAKFPDMKGLADYVHARGLKLGIYSSPGPRSCAGFEGSYGHVEQDARTFAAWGVDYLKYDLCSGEAFYRTYEQVRAAYQAMGAALQAIGRSIVFSLCEYGRFDVGAWGRKAGGNLWRTTGDIRDDYKAMASIGFDKTAPAQHAGPGGWNDPDMLEIGNGGMDIEEYRSHLSLWALLAAPLLLGNDVRRMSEMTLALIANRELIAVDQDALGRQASRTQILGGIEIWVKPLADGALAVGLFNRGGEVLDVPPSSFRALGLGYRPQLRDLWRHVNMGSSEQIRARIPPHGVLLLKAMPGA